MKKLWLLLVCLCMYGIVNAQYSVSQDVDRLFYCTPSTVMRELGKVQSFNANTFKGFKYHFYYYNSGVYNEIGYFIAQLVGATIFTSYGNLDPTYFNGSQIINATKVLQSGPLLWMSIDIPYSTFPNNNTGQQLVVDVEAIDQGGSTTVHSSKTFMNVPLLYTNPVVLSSPTINPASTTICSGNTVQLSSSPNYAGNGFFYDWYKDGSPIALNDNTGNFSATATGSYYAIVHDACQTVTSSTAVISPGTVPGKPTISLPGLPLCNGASGTMTANGSGGTYTWSTGAVANTLSISVAGNYSVHESNGCGAGPESDPVTITTASSPTPPVVSSGNGTLLCNGGSTVLSASPSFGGTIYWNTGAMGTTYTVSTAGSYSAWEASSCGNSSISNIVTITTSSTAPAPTLSISGNEILCNGSGQTITTSPSTSGGVIHWSNGATGNSITVYSAGTYYAWETNACGNSANSASLNVTTLNTPAAPTVTPAGPVALCGGASTTLNSTGTVAPNILWFFNGSSTGHFGATYDVSAAGSYTTKELSSCGTSGASNVVNIVTNSTPPAPSLNVSGTILLCDGAGQTISASPGTGGGVLHWSTGATGNSITVTAPGNYYAWETNGSCGTGPNSAVVTITTLNTPPAPSVNPPTNQLLCNGASATLTSSGSTITWSNGTTGNTLVTAAAGNYYAIDRNACGNSGPSNTVVITTGTCPIPAPGTSFFVCPGTMKTIDAGAGYESYLWNTGATTQTITVGPGSYSVTVMKNGCYANSATVTVSYYTVSSSFITASGPTSFCAGSSVTLSSSVGSAYAWSSGANTQSIVVNASGTYFVTVTDANGCQMVSAPVAVTVNPLPNASISGSTTICQGSAAPSVIFTGSAGTPPYTFTYKLNGGSNQTITTVSGNSVAISIPTSSAGTYSYTLVGVSESSGTTCSNSASGNASVVVNPLPTASISGTTAVCQNSAAPSITFTGSGATAPYTFTYSINGGSAQTITTVSGNSVSVSVATSTTGVYTYTLLGVKESSNTSCNNAAAGSASVAVNPLPGATISGNTTVCQNSAQPQITFTGSNGTAPYTFSYRINGGSIQTVNTTSGNSVAVNAPTNAAGIFVYSLVSVQEASGTSCVSAVSGNATVVVNPLPTATIAGSSSVCQNGSSPFITFTGSGATAPYTFIYKINGGANQSVTTTSGNSVTVAVPTTTAGTFTYSLVSVQESSGVSCGNTASGSATVVVNPLPTATIAGTTSVCQNSVAPSLTFTGAGATPPYTFTFKINGGANQTVTTTSGSSVTITAPTNAAGTFIYSLVSVQESSGNSCSNAVSGSATITVNALPSAMVAGTTSVCQYGASPLITFTGSNANAPYTFTYSINNGPAQTLTTVSGNSVSVNAPTTATGTFTYSLISVKESSGTTCSNAVTGSVVITVNPQPVKATIAAPNMHLCNGETGIITVTNYASGFTYTWYKDGVLFRTTTLDTIHVTDAGNYTVMATSDKGCNAATVSDPITITTGSVTTPVITGYLHVCPQGKTRLLIQPIEGMGQYDVWKWTEPPDKKVLSGDSIFSALAGQYKVWVMAQGCADSTSVTVTADDTVYPAGQLIITPKEVPYGGKATLIAAVKGAVQYEWKIGNDPLIQTPSDTIIQHFYHTSDSLPVVVKAISERNCISSFLGSIKVGALVFDTIPDHSVMGNLKDWNVFPIPFHNELKVSMILSRNQTVRIDLFAMDGRWVKAYGFAGKKGENLFVLDRLENLPLHQVFFITAVYNGQKHFDKIYKE
ncbi:MAG: hypothetical protein V4557_12800 [Bacteroidota bacterium]